VSGLLLAGLVMSANPHFNAANAARPAIARGTLAGRVVGASVDLATLVEVAGEADACTLRALQAPARAVVILASGAALSRAWEREAVAAGRPPAGPVTVKANPRAVYCETTPAARQAAGAVRRVPSVDAYQAACAARRAGTSEAVNACGRAQRRARAAGDAPQRGGRRGKRRPRPGVTW